MRILGPSILTLIRSAAVGAILAACAPATVIAQTVPLDALMRGGRIHYSGGRYERAVEQFSKALEQYGGQVENTQLAEIHTWLGLGEAQLRNSATAADHFRFALDADSGCAERIQKDEQWQYWARTALINTARNTYNAGVYDSSLVFALAALKIDPTKSSAYSLVANSYSALDRYEEMLATAREMVELDPESPQGLSLIGLYYLQKPDSLWPEEMKQARWDSCASYYDQAIGIYEKQFKEAVKTLGEQLGNDDTGQLDEVARGLVARSRAGNQAELKRFIEEDLKAEKQYAQVAQLASRLFYAANNLNVSASRAGSAMLRASSEFKGDDAVAFRDRAESHFETALEYDPYDFAAVFNLGIVQYQAQNDSLAAVSFQRVVDGAVVGMEKLPVEWHDSLLELITPEKIETGYLSLEGALAGAIDSVLATIGYPAGNYRWVYFPELKEQENFEAATAEDVPSMFLSLEPPGALENIYLLLGVAQTGIGLAWVDAERADDAAGMFNTAITSLLSVLDLNPQNAEAWQNLGHCYRETKQTKKALAAFKKYGELSE